MPSFAFSFSLCVHPARTKKATLLNIISQVPHIIKSVWATRISLGWRVLMLTSSHLSLWAARQLVVAPKACSCRVKADQRRRRDRPPAGSPLILMPHAFMNEWIRSGTRKGDKQDYYEICSFYACSSYAFLRLKNNCECFVTFQPDSESWGGFSQKLKHTGCIWEF